LLQLATCMSQTEMREKNKKQAMTGVGAVFVCILVWNYSRGGGIVGTPGEGGEGSYIDMHSHTTESDGDRSAEDQLKLASSFGMKSMWITDHDLIRDLDRTVSIQAYAKSVGVQVGFGVEITVLWLKKEHHLLGYFPDSIWNNAKASNALSTEMATLQVACAKVKSSRETRNNLLVKWLNDVLGQSSPLATNYFKDAASAANWTPVKVVDVAAWAKEFAALMEPTSLGRPHFSKYLGTKGVNMDLVFGPRSGSGRGVLTADGKVFFDSDADGKDGVKLEALMHSATLGRREILFNPLPIVDAIRLIQAAGGRAVIAHPPTLGKAWHEKFGADVGRLATEAGLWGIEGYSSEISPENHILIEELAKTNGLVMTGGSDNHGTLKSYARLGDVHRHGTDLYTALETWARDGAIKSQRLHDLSDF